MKTSTRSFSSLDRIAATWCAVNYLPVRQIHLFGYPLLKRPNWSEYPMDPTKTGTQNTPIHSRTRKTAS